MGLMESIITAVQNSPAWASTAILLTFGRRQAALGFLAAGLLG
jgi:hypothetical protein